jgi:hypothetical protein
MVIRNGISNVPKLKMVARFTAPKSKWNQFPE